MLSANSTPHVGEFVYFAKWLQTKERKKNHGDSKQKGIEKKAKLKKWEWRPLKCSKNLASSMLIGRSFFSSVFFQFYDINMFCTSKNPGSRQCGMRFDLSHLLNAIAKIENTRRSTHTIGILDSWEWHAVEKQQTHTPHTQANAKKNGTTSKRVSKREIEGMASMCFAYGKKIYRPAL